MYSTDSHIQGSIAHTDRENQHFYFGYFTHILQINVELVPVDFLFYRFAYKIGICFTLLVKNCIYTTY